MNIICPKCNSKTFYLKSTGPHQALRCKKCDTWIKNTTKEEVVFYSQKEKTNFDYLKEMEFEQFWATLCTKLCIPISSVSLQECKSWLQKPFRDQQPRPIIAPVDIEIDECPWD